MLVQNDETLNKSNRQTPLRSSKSLNKSFDAEQSLESKVKRVVEDAKREVDNMIEQLDTKIAAKIERNEAVFLLAYKHNMEKIKKQLKILKDTYDAHERKFSSNNEVVRLTKQCILFRQEAMRLNEQLEDALAQMDIYRRKSQILEKEIKKTDELVKKLMYSNKILEAEKGRMRNVTNKPQTANPNKMQRQQSLETCSKKDQTDEVSIKVPHTIEMIDNRHEGNQFEISKDEVSEWHDSKIAMRAEPINQLPHYSIFEKNFYKDVPLHPYLGNNKICHSRNKTYSNLTYDHSSRLLETNPSQIYKSYLQEEENLVKNFLDHVRKASQEQDKGSPQIVSKNILQFINNKADICNFCSYVFPHFKIDKTTMTTMTTIQAENQKRKRDNSQRRKAISQLSAQLIRKLEGSKPKMQKKKAEQRAHTETNIQIGNELIMKLQGQAIERDMVTSLNKMNSYFKRKKMGSNKSNIGFGERSARLVIDHR